MDNETKKYLDDRHKIIYDKIGTLEAQVAPISKIYNSVNGFGNVASWIFKLFIIPVSVIVAIWYQIKGNIHF